MNETNKYGECAATDVAALVRQMNACVQRHRAQLELDEPRIVSQILTFIRLRQNASFQEISDPLFAPSTPDGWDDEDEEIWREWIDFTFTDSTWNREVIEPVFGSGSDSDIRLWEAQCEGWRSELVFFLPWWIKRSMYIVTKFDPTQLEPEDEENENPDIDAYILDHGSAKQRKAALRSGI